MHEHSIDVDKAAYYDEHDKRPTKRVAYCDVFLNFMARLLLDTLTWHRHRMIAFLLLLQEEAFAVCAPFPQRLER